MNKVLLTFDYEIYFDGSNKYVSLVENTDRILEMADKGKTRLVFFIDIFYLLKLEETGQMKAYSELETQIRDIVSREHEIQYHFHPHWINASYDVSSDLWTYDRTEYSLSDIIVKYGHSKAVDQFNRGIEKLRSISGSTPIAYRSGGLSVNSYQELLFDLLISNGIRYDSSIMPGLYVKGENILIDHTNAPVKGKWTVSREGGFISDAGNSNEVITEIPVMSVDRSRIGFISKIFVSFRYRISVFMSRKSVNERSSSGKPIDLKLTRSEYPTGITFDKSWKRDIIILKFYTDVYLSNGRDVMCVLSHPKSFYSQSFSLFETYIAWLNSNKYKYKVVGFADL